jgi:coenzyme F420-reducing hydrogenase gamma subunit
VDIAFVEGSVYTPEDVDRIRRIRASSRYLISIGACATSGGIQALRNLGDTRDWVGAIYARPEYIQTLDQSRAIAEEVKVDLELWGCPVTTAQVVAAIRALLYGVAPVKNRDKVCMDCKRNQTVCTLVAKGEPCLGPVTGTGCGALCPAFGRDCYGCFGPAENPNTAALARASRAWACCPWISPAASCSSPTMPRPSRPKAGNGGRRDERGTPHRDRGAGAGAGGGRGRPATCVSRTAVSSSCNCASSNRRASSRNSSRAAPGTRCRTWWRASAASARWPTR